MGFAGSFHCIGMCSPLVLAISANGKNALIRRVIYNAGRISTYGLLGAIVSAIGMALPLLKFQNAISLGLGILLIAFSIFQMRLHIPVLTKAASALSGVLKTLFSRYIQKRNYGSVFILGSLNGLLPCGLTLLALTYCLTLADPLSGFNYMLLFGLGTMPVMLGLTSVLLEMVKRYNLNLKKVSTAILLISGCILIARVFIMHTPSHEEQRLVDIVLCR
ncbi:sulfite exporter TauE/SafE family protein [Chryseosolibacter indicus]|nr:sulfite exporter TauE/SafE family protein [Chryseosolibacter indicus]